MACWRARLRTDEARSYVIFSLDPAARFSDALPVTADDVIFSWQRARAYHGDRAFYSKVAEARNSTRARSF